jgi:hypothetical protein
MSGSEKSIGTQVAEQLRAYLAKQRAEAGKPKAPRPKPELVAESEVVPESITAGTIRPVGAVLEKLDPEGAKGARFVRATKVTLPTEELYWQEVNRQFNRDPKRGVLVRFEYHPFDALKKEFGDD